MAPRKSTTTEPFHLDFSPLRDQRLAFEPQVTQRMLAEAIGVHYVTVWRYEANREVPSAVRLVAMSRALGVPMSSLFVVRDGARPA